jgi:hypothetical protein
MYAAIAIGYQVYGIWGTEAKSSFVILQSVKKMYNQDVQLVLKLRLVI